MKPLIDSDILLYEVGFSSEKNEVVDGVKIVTPASWDFCQDILDRKIKLICDEVGATGPPLLFLTNTHYMNKTLNKQRVREDRPVTEYKENFRVDVAKEKDYKAGRSATKPFHFRNIIHYLINNYDVHVNENGLEADDALCIKQYSAYKNGELTTIICSRDKDVRMCPGNHYSWESGKQASIGPILVDELGFLEKRKDGKTWGVGGKFFYYQLLIGDTVDNIGGIKGRGPAYAYKLLWDATTLRQCYELVAEEYVRTWGDEWKVKMKEQVNLLWMVRELDEKGEKILWMPPKSVT